MPVESISLLRRCDLLPSPRDGKTLQIGNSHLDSGQGMLCLLSHNNTVRCSNARPTDLETPGSGPRRNLRPLVDAL